MSDSNLKPAAPPTPATVQAPHAWGFLSSLLCNTTFDTLVEPPEHRATTPESVEYEVIVSQHGVPQASVRASVEGHAELTTKRAVRTMIASTYEGEGFTFDVVEPCDEDGLELAVRSMMALSPCFAERVRGVA